MMRRFLKSIYDKAVMTAARLLRCGCSPSCINIYIIAIPIGACQNKKKKKNRGRKGIFKPPIVPLLD